MSDENDYKRNRKRDKGWRNRDSKKSNYNKRGLDIDEAELLRIQGLTKCLTCAGVFPQNLITCPHCLSE